MKRDGRADMGVSMWELLELELPGLLPRLDVLLEVFECCCCCCCDTGAGGCGRAKGLGGPDAPALSKALALGEGGGRTTPEECEPPVSARRDGCVPDAPVDSRGEESAVPLASDASSGICTLSCGRLAPRCALLVLEGGVKVVSGIDDIEGLRCLSWVCARCGGAGGLLALVRELATSIDKDRFVAVVSLRDVSAADVELAQCCDKIDRLSSIGVNILRDFTETRLTCGSSIGCG